MGRQLQNKKRKDLTAVINKPQLVPVQLRLLYQDAVEEFMYEEPQDAGQNVGHMIEEFHIHNHGLIASDECSTVAHEAHHEHNLVGQL